MPVPRNTWLVAGLLVVALGLSYANSLRAPLIFDDEYSIADNPSLRQLWPLSVPLSPPVSSFTAGRPLLNLSFALNHAISGLEVGSYHAVNLLIHLAAALMLFGLVRRTLALPRVRWPAGTGVTWIAFTVTAVWSLHPLLTQCVTYLSQRAESLMGLCYLATLYSVLRGATATRGAGWWYGAAILACAAGMAVKEVMVTAPLLVLAFDRAFLATSFREIARRRGALYAGLAATWALLAYLMIATGFGEHGVGFQGPFTPGSYLLAESQVIANYLKLAVWPIRWCSIMARRSDGMRLGVVMARAPVGRRAAGRFVRAGVAGSPGRFSRPRLFYPPRAHVQRGAGAASTHGGKPALPAADSPDRTPGPQPLPLLAARRAGAGSGRGAGLRGAHPFPERRLCERLPDLGGYGAEKSPEFTRALQPGHGLPRRGAGKIAGRRSFRAGPHPQPRLCGGSYQSRECPGQPAGTRSRSPVSLREHAAAEAR